MSDKHAFFNIFSAMCAVQRSRLLSYAELDFLLYLVSVWNENSRENKVTLNNKKYREDLRTKDRKVIYLYLRKLSELGIINCESYNGTHEFTFTTQFASKQIRKKTQRTQDAHSGHSTQSASTARKNRADTVRNTADTVRNTADTVRSEDYQYRAREEYYRVLQS